MEGGEKVGKLSDVMTRITSIARETAHLPVPIGARIARIPHCASSVRAVTLPEGIIARSSSNLFDPVFLQHLHFNSIPELQLSDADKIQVTTLQDKLKDDVFKLRNRVQKDGTAYPFIFIYLYIVAVTFSKMR